MAKGGRFERDICYQLTEWWAGGRAADVLFWRTAGSGGRATVRGNRKTARGHCGDVAAIDESATPLTDLLSLELKAGYNHASLHDLLDGTGDNYPYNAWIQQAVDSAARAGVPYWWLIHWRSRRHVTLTMPARLWDELGANPPAVDAPAFRATVPNRWRGLPPGLVSFVSCRFSAFLAGITPREIRRLRDAHREKGRASGCGILPGLPANADIVTAQRQP